MFVLLFANGLPFYVPKDINQPDTTRDLVISDDMWDDKGRRDGTRLNDAQMRAYQRYAEETNQTLSGESLKNILDRLGDNDYVKLFLKLNFPLAQDNPFKFFEKDGRVFLINKQDPVENYYINPNTGNLITGRMSGTSSTSFKLIRTNICNSSSIKTKNCSKTSTRTNGRTTTSSSWRSSASCSN